MRRRAALAGAVLCSGIGMGVVLAGCGGSGDEHDRSVASQAAAQALAQERQRQEDAAQRARLRRLKRKLAHEKGNDAQKAASAAAGAGGGSSGGSGSSGGGGSKDCGSGVTANAAATCSFALNVADEYRASGGASKINVYSPVTKQTYTMFCTGASTTTCTGGNNAVVTFS
jgi:hypothetical protein